MPVSAVSVGGPATVVSAYGFQCRGGYANVQRSETRSAPYAATAAAPATYLRHSR
ncbi:hypothetical protein IW248_002136 [Micromonospora ureilytica]|uniref:Uncharacterized protein n=1 Tax=Micromonospora ureilytica TaxID=709868 RepID=A0ABS0JFS6_9ACTN|nr:hypothetical protein [Micromonospora ureilytica]